MTNRAWLLLALTTLALLPAVFADTSPQTHDFRLALWLLGAFTAGWFIQELKR